MLKFNKNEITSVINYINSLPDGVYILHVRKLKDKLADYRASHFFQVSEFANETGYQKSEIRDLFKEYRKALNKPPSTKDLHTDEEWVDYLNDFDLFKIKFEHIL